MPDVFAGLNARPMLAALRGERGSTAASAAEETITSLRETIANEEYHDGGRPVNTRDEAAWIVSRRGVLSALSAEARALAAAPWTGTLDALLDRCEDIRRRIPPRNAPDDFDDPELRAIRLFHAATYRAASVDSRRNLEAALIENAHPTIRRACYRLEELLRFARGEMRRARTEEERRAATVEIHKYQQALAAIGDAERAPPENPAETAKKILAAEGR